MRRVAFFSPLPPDTSGIADYSAELLPALAAHCRLELYTARPAATDRALRDAFPVHGYGDFAGRDGRGLYEAVLYQIGNSAEHHAAIYSALVARPGIVALHEHMLHHLVRDMHLLRRTEQGFREEMRYCYGPTGLRMAPRLLLSSDSPEIWDYPLFERVADRAQALIVHSHATRERVLASRPHADITVVPHHLSLRDTRPADAEARARLLAELGLPADAFVVASFGHLTRSKRLEIALRAFARLKRRHPQAAYLLVGEVSHAYTEFEELIAGERGEGVVTTGRVSLDRLLELMAGCDVAVNLRHPTGGETSGACLRLLGLGRPVVVTEAGWFAEIPDDACAKVPVGRDEEALLTAVLGLLVESPGLRRQMGRNAARWAAEEHRLADSARGYAECIERIAAAPPQLRAPAPPLVPTPPEDVATTLTAALAAALADLGLDSGAHELHRSVAGTLVDLDLDRTGQP